MVICITKSDGNGGQAINFPVAVFAVIVTIMISIIPAAFAYGSLSQQVNNLEEDWAKEAPKYDSNVKDITKRLTDLEKLAARTDVSLETIQEDINEIKIDLKSIIKEMREVKI